MFHGPSQPGVPAQQFLNGALELNYVQQVDKTINSCHSIDISIIQRSQQF